MSDTTSVSNLEHGDPERRVVMRDYQDPNYTVEHIDRINLNLLLDAPLAELKDFDSAAYQALTDLVEIWTQPIRSQEHLRNAKFRLEREWPEFYKAINTLVQAAVDSDDQYKAWLAEHPVQERKS